MLANYHTHTWRCGHAEGTEEEYIQRAMEEGFQLLGFSDHAPYAYPGGYRSFYHMGPEQDRDYFETIARLRDRYAGQIELHMGVEAEYYPALFEELLTRLRKYGCEYMILGQHYTFNETDGVYAGHPTQDAAVLTQYVDQSIEALETGLFTYMAHPDILNWQGEEGLYRREMGRLCETCRKLQIPLEINLAGMGEGRHYPSRLFWQIAGEVGSRAILGWDVHAPREFHVPEVVDRARALAADCGVELLDRVELRPIG